MRLRVELDVIFEKYVHVTQLGTNLKNATIYDNFIFFRKNGTATKVKRVSKIWVRMSTTNIHLGLLQFKIQSHL